MNQGNDTKKRKKWKHLSERERYNIELLLKEDYSVKAIAAHLDRDRRTIQKTPMKGLTSFNSILCKSKVSPSLFLNVQYNQGRILDV